MVKKGAPSILQCSEKFLTFFQKKTKKNKQKKTKITHMVFILAASSLHHAFETSTPEEKERYKDKIYSIPGLSLNPYTKNPRKF